jgi:hypothetical protein
MQVHAVLTAKLQPRQLQCRSEANIQQQSQQKVAVWAATVQWVAHQLLTCLMWLGVWQYCCATCAYFSAMAKFC